MSRIPKSKSKVVADDNGLVLAGSVAHPDVEARKAELTDSDNLRKTQRSILDLSEKLDLMEGAGGIFDDVMSVIPDDGPALPASTSAPETIDPDIADVEDDFPAASNALDGGQDDDLDNAAPLMIGGADDDDTSDEADFDVSGFEDVAGIDETGREAGDPAADILTDLSVDDEITAPDALPEIEDDGLDLSGIAGSEEPQSITDHVVEDDAADLLSDEPADTIHDVAYDDAEDDLPSFDTISDEESQDNAVLSVRALGLDEIMAIDGLEDEDAPVTDDHFTSFIADDASEDVFNGISDQTEEPESEPEEGDLLDVDSSSNFDRLSSMIGTPAGIEAETDSMDESVEAMPLPPFDEGDEAFADDVAGTEELPSPPGDTDPEEAELADPWRLDDDAELPSVEDDISELVAAETVSDQAEHVDIDIQDVPKFDLSEDIQDEDELPGDDRVDETTTEAPVEKKGILMKLFGGKKKAAKAEDQADEEAIVDAGDAAGDEDAVDHEDHEQPEDDTAADDEVAQKPQSKLRKFGIPAAACIAMLGFGGYYYTLNQSQNHGQAQAPRQQIPQADYNQPAPSVSPAEVASTQPAPQPAPQDDPLADLRDDPAANPADIAAQPTQAPQDAPAGAAAPFGGLADNLVQAGSGDISDLFSEPRPEPAAGTLDAAMQGFLSEYARTETVLKTLDGYAKGEAVEEISSRLEEANSRLDQLDQAIAERDTRIGEMQAQLTAAQEVAVKAEQLAVAQNDIILKYVRVQEKVDIGEKYIEDLSVRVAELERIEPADRIEVERQFTAANDRIEGLARDVGLIARVAIQGDARGSGVRSSSETDVPGGAAVYEETRPNKKPAGLSPDAVPANAKKGDFVEGYGYVLDVQPTSEGKTLIVMENGTVIKG